MTLTQELKEINKKLKEANKQLKQFKKDNAELLKEIKDRNIKDEKLYAFIRFIYDEFKKPENQEGWIDKIEGIGQHENDDKNDEEMQELDDILSRNYIQNLTLKEIEFLLKAFGIDYTDY